MNSVRYAEDFSRREFLRSAGVMALGTMVVPTWLRTQSPSATGISPKNRVDVHHHILPPGYMLRARDRILGISDRDHSRLLNWTPAGAIEEMDKAGIGTAITSLGLPGVWFRGVKAARTLARECNEFAAKMAKDFPGRFGFFAAVPLPDQDGSLREAEYALDVLKADGIGLVSSYDNKWPGDAAFTRVFEELNRRKAVVFIHPAVPACCDRLMPGIPTSTIEFLFDTTRAITSLLVSGTFSRFPDIRFIFCHAGGTMPMVAARTEAFVQRHKEIADRLPNGAAFEFKRLFFDVANSTSPSAISALMNFVPTSQILFGTDFPYVPAAVTTAGVDHFGLSAGDLQAINRENATRLFPRLRA
jgi:predicted TIM-barrel fold metal-dependent hydrolase